MAKVKVTFYFDGVSLEDIIGVIEPRITDIFGYGCWEGDTYIEYVGLEYVVPLIRELDVELPDGFTFKFIHNPRNDSFDVYISEKSDKDELPALKLATHKLAAGCKRALKERKEYTDNLIKNLMSIDIYQGKERATGKFKTTVKWSYGEVVTLRADKNTLPIYYIFAYAYCERKYGSNSAFKKYVNRHCVKMDKELIFEDDGLMTSMRIYQYGNGHPAIDLYSRVALLIAAKAYGGVETLKKVASEALH